MDKVLRKLPEFRGKLRLARWLFSNTIENKTDIKVTGRFSCQYVLPNIIETVGFDIFVNGQYEPEIYRLIAKLLPNNGCFLDLGGNIGSIVIPVCKQRPDVKAVTVEAAPWIFGYLQKNVALNKLQNITLVNIALFDQDDVELDFFSPNEKYGKGSLSPVFTSEAIKVKTVKLDTLVKKLKLPFVNLIKIDVEGFEYFVFKGAMDLLASDNAPVIIFEFADWAEEKAMGLKPGAAQQLLIDFGYKLYEMNGIELRKLDHILISGSYNLLASKSSLQL